MVAGNSREILAGGGVGFGGNTTASSDRKKMTQPVDVHRHMATTYTNGCKSPAKIGHGRRHVGSMEEREKRRGHCKSLLWHRLRLVVTNKENNLGFFK